VVFQSHQCQHTLLFLVHSLHQQERTCQHICRFLEEIRHFFYKRHKCTWWILCTACSLKLVMKTCSRNVYGNVSLFSICICKAALRSAYSFNAGIGLWTMPYYILYWKYGTHCGNGQTSQVESYLTGQNKVITQYLALPKYLVAQKLLTKQYCKFLCYLMN
jgi:hypothetical protein